MAAAARAQEASSSISRCTYHVFLSFRGEDTRKNFIDHLHGALERAIIHTFLDDDGIERGENIQAELQKAIEESKISIIVFSRDYASSRWCLDELVKIMEQKKTAGLIVLPVFYHVDPSQVRSQSGSFGEAFAIHETRFKMDKVESWRAALREVANLAGKVLGDGYERQFIRDIVKEIQEKLYPPVQNVASHLVGIDSRVKYINQWLQDGSSGIATIFGIGGIGKTIVARTVYTENFERFQCRSFIANVKNTLKECNGLVRLQSQLLSDLNGKMNTVSNVDKTIMMIKDAIHRRKVLIVFDDVDDVDDLDQLDAIIGRQECVCPGSKIIITTRHVHLPWARTVCKKFEIKALDANDSLKLFSWHAFGQDHPTSEDYIRCSRKVVDRLGGLPLALRILGSFLSGQGIDVWESALQKLEAIQNNKVHEVLKISYDSLQDECDQNLFLDIACFFIGEDKDYTIAILDGCNFSTVTGIQSLINRCLLTIDEGNKLMMHQLVKDMATEIIRQESTEDPGNRSRLCHHKDAFTVLKEKTGTQTVKGLTFDLPRLMEDKHKKTIVDLETNTFKMMDKLKLLQLKNVKLQGDYKDFSKNLIWLCWHGFHEKYIPANFYMEKLVALDMRYSSLKCVWKRMRFLADLKFLNLSHSHCLVKTPDFSGLPSLERLILKDCINLIKVDESIGNLDRLLFLDLMGCKSLKKLPREIGMLKSLEKLILHGCSKLDELPRELWKMESLKDLDAAGTAINQSYTTTSDTKKLCWFSRTGTRYSMSFSLAILPHSLVRLSLAYCNLSDDAISYGLASFPSLRDLNLSGSSFHSFPESIKGLTMLKTLSLAFCTGLQSLPEFPKSLNEIMLSGCTSLKKVSDLSILSSLPDLWLQGCEKLFEIEGIFKLEPLKNADVAVIESLGLSNLESLGSLQVDMWMFGKNIWRTPLQVLHECVVSIFLPGSEIPSCFNHQSMGSSISFDVPQLDGRKVRGLNLCVGYALGSEYTGTSNYKYAIISNKTKRVRWTYMPTCHAIPTDGENDMLWFSHWKIGEQLEVGDHVDVSVGDYVKMCGIRLVYEAEDKGTQSNNEETVPSAFPWYQTVTLTKARADAFFHCHHSFKLYEYVRDGISLNKLFDNTYWTERNPQLELDTCFLCTRLRKKLLFLVA